MVAHYDKKIRNQLSRTAWDRIGEDTWITSYQDIFRYHSLEHFFSSLVVGSNNAIWVHDDGFWWGAAVESIYNGLKWDFGDS